MQQQIPQVSNSDGEFGPTFNTAIARGIVPPRSNDSTSHPNPALMYDDGANPALSQEESAGSAHTGVSNPLVPEQPAFISDDSGTLRYLGHSSTWSFSRQVLHMAHQSPHSHSSPKGSVHVEGQAYKIDLQKPTVSETDIAGLPSIDLSLYYLQTLKFRTCPLFYLFDDAQFTSHLHCFYESPAAYAQKFQAWFVHYLVLMAFAKALSGSNPPTNVSSSFELFSRALHLLPEITQLCEDPVGSTEILCCIALYLQSIDHRVAASIYVSFMHNHLGFLF
jgi:proline utilization trans-activator